MPYCYRYTLHEKSSINIYGLAAIKPIELKTIFRMEICSGISIAECKQRVEVNAFYVCLTLGSRVHLIIKLNSCAEPGLTFFCLFISLSQPFRPCVIPSIFPCALLFCCNCFPFPQFVSSNGRLLFNQ